MSSFDKVESFGTMFIYYHDFVHRLKHTFVFGSNLVTSRSVLAKGRRCCVIASETTNKPPPYKSGGLFSRLEPVGSHDPSLWGEKPSLETCDGTPKRDAKEIAA